MSNLNGERSIDHSENTLFFYPFEIGEIRDIISSSQRYVHQNPWCIHD